MRLRGIRVICALGVRLRRDAVRETRVLRESGEHEGGEAELLVGGHPLRAGAVCLELRRGRTEQVRQRRWVELREHLLEQPGNVRVVTLAGGHYCGRRRGLVRRGVDAVSIK